MSSSFVRLFITISAFYGYGMAVERSEDIGHATEALSQLASLLTGVCYLGLLCYPLFTGGRRVEPTSSWLRGALAVLLILVSVTFLTMLEGDLAESWSLFEHLITPLLVVVDWAFVGRGQTRVAWWHPLTWTLFPLAYLMYYLSQDLYFYGSMLDPDSSDFGATIAGFLAGVVAAGYVLYGIGKVRGQLLSPQPGAAMPPSGPYASQPYTPQQPYAPHPYAPQQPYASQPYAPQPYGQPPAYGPQPGYPPNPYPQQPQAPQQQPGQPGGF